MPLVCKTLPVRSDSFAWRSEYTDNQWIYIDLGESESSQYRTVVHAHAKSYKLHVSDDELLNYGKEIIQYGFQREA